MTALQRIFSSAFLVRAAGVSAEAHPQMFDNAYLVFSSLEVKPNLETLRFPVVRTFAPS